MPCASSREIEMRILSTSKNAILVRNRRRNRIVNGLCPRCGDTPASGVQHCKRCNDYHLEQGKRRKDKISAYKRSPQYRARLAELRSMPEWRQRHNLMRNAARRARKRTDVAFAMVDRLRKRIGRAVRDRLGCGKYKADKTAALIGCTVPELMAHLESRFLPGMSWENRHLWHIDHVTPCAAFDLSDPTMQKICFHYANLQPLWAPDNISKKDNIL
jgi:hypothetical protein